MSTGRRAGTGAGTGASISASASTSTSTSTSTKILHISGELPLGGPRRMAADVACRLHDMGHSNTLAAFHGELTASLEAAGLSLHTRHSGGLLAQRQEVSRLANLLRSLRADAAIAYTAEAARLCRMASSLVPVSCRPRLVGMMCTPPRFGEGRRGWGCCDALACVSAHLRDHCCKRLSFCREHKPAVIPYGVDTALCHPAFRPAAGWKENRQREHPVPPDSYTLCIPGALSPLHGLEDLAPLLTGLQRAGIPTHAFIVGDTRRADPVFLEQLTERFRAAGVSRHITLLPPGPDMRETLCSCDVVVSLAHAPACCDRALLEALALGCPVAAYDHGVAGELLNAFLPEGRVAPGDIAAMTDTLTQWRTYRLEDSAQALLQLCRRQS